MNQKPDNSSGRSVAPAGSRSQHVARAPSALSRKDSGPNQTNLKLTHGDGARPQSNVVAEWCACSRLAASHQQQRRQQQRTELFVTSSNHQRYRNDDDDDLALLRRISKKTSRRRTRTTTVGVHLRVEGPTATTMAMTTPTTINPQRRTTMATTNGGQPFRCGNILLPLIAATLLLLSAQTFAFAAVGAHDQQPRQAASLIGHTHQLHQQVDARLIPRANEESGRGAAPKVGDGGEKIQRATAASEHATLVRRSNADQLSSAEMPAEFRGGDEQPKEQSRLARLCEQTSSVLASVLPAPFGGHKRSILCQFFGQVQVGAGTGTASGGKQRLQPPSLSRQPTQQQGLYPISGVSLPPELRFPVGAAQFEVPTHQESIAILQQNQQPPVAMVATGRHPIQMVLEHQQRQLAASAVANRPPQVPTGWTYLQAQQQQQSQDLSVESSIHDRRAVPMQELAGPPQKQIKFSAPLASPSPSASSPQMSSGGWRISNGTSAHQDTSASTPTGSSTTPMPRVNQTLQISSASEMPASQAPPKTGAVQLSIGKRTSETPHEKSTPADVRVSPGTGADNSKESVAVSGGDRVRTIEVSAQEVPATSDRPVQSRQASQGSDLGPSDASSRPNDARQVQKREELVIASINNLTRIAFGNHLRDTVKVINKLIDQQAAVFSGQHQAAGDLASSQREDPMLTSESVGRPQAMPMIILHHKPGGDKTQDSSQLAKTEPKLSANSNKEHKGKATLASPKLNSGSSEGAAGTVRDNLKTATGRTHQTNLTVAASDQKPKLGQRTGNNINSSKLGEQLTTRQERISSSSATNKLKSTPTTTTTAASSKQATALTSGGSVSTRKATSVGGQKSVAAAGASNKKVTSPAKKQQGTPTSPKSGGGGGAKESDKRKATNHSQRTTAKFSHSVPAHARNKDQQHQLNQSSTASVELRRLTTIGRALIMQNEPTAGGGKHESGRPKSRSEIDLAVAQTINDLSRPVTSTWLPSRGPAVGSTTLAMRKLHKIKGDSYKRELEPRLASTSWTSTSLAMSPASWSQAQSSTVTQFPWLLPDKSALASSEAGGDLAPASSAEVHLVQSVDAHPRAPDASSTTRRMVTPYDSDQFSSAFTGVDSSPRQNSPLALNRIDTTRRLDSLTTLKMALTRASSTTSTPRPSVTESTTPTRSTPLPFFSAGTTQSRWLPSTAFLAPRQSAAATTTTTTAPTTFMRSSSPALVSPSASSTLEMIANSYGNAPSTVPAGSSVSDLDEARASETVSKYTTHLSDAAANEQLSTRRGQHFQLQQSLPQIANTGDYFSAETIASWPEKYHTMVSRAMSSSATVDSHRPTTASFETTRRNGESYETSPTAGVTTLSRHRLDDARAAGGDTTRPVGSLVGVISSNAPGITILPANHKLMASSSSLSTESESGTPTQELRPATQPMDTATVFVSTEAPPRQTKQPPPPPPYTLLDPSTMPLADGNSSAIQEISQSTTVGDGETTLAAINSTSGANSMRPPYNANYDFGDLQQLSDPALVLDQSQSRPYVSKKLYELLTPGGGSSSGQTFAGAAHPARSQRFNWSALKYLAQNLLMATHGRHNETSNGMKNYTTGELDEEGEAVAANETGETQQVAAGKTDQQQLYDLMTRSSLPPLNDYYELAGNESTATGAEHQLDEPANQLLNSSYQQQRGKGIFERASNLLSEMKQLEQKRAAALMAAFRYQVPGPLIKPWDPIAQATHHSPASISKFFSDRLDTLGAGSGRAAPPSLSPAQLLTALRSALFKQKLVARDELEARLNSGRRRADQVISTERRNDDDGASPSVKSTTNDERLEILPSHDNSTISLEDLEYILAANETAFGQDGEMLRDGGGGSNSTTLLKTMLGRLFGDGGNSSASQTAPTNSSGQPERDFHLIDLSANDADGKRSQTSEPSPGRPKYIRLLDYQTALTRKPLDDKAKRLFAPAGGSNGGQSRQAMAEVMARLRSPAMGAVTTAATEPSIEFQHASKGQAAATASESEQFKSETDPSSFDCEGRSAGFYPDAGSLCQTFYHCSNTGHLLTFNCPSSTRFDEKSLKCGPWYEVSCDIGRVRTRRY